MEVQHKEIKNKGKFYISYMEDNNVEIASMTYTLSAPNELTINHTEVNPAYKGQRLALRLIGSTVDYARECEYKVVPECSYATTISRESRNSLMSSGNKKMR